MSVSHTINVLCLFQGRQAMEWVIERLKTETTGLRRIAQESIDTMADLTPPRLAHCQGDDTKTS